MCTMMPVVLGQQYEKGGREGLESEKMGCNAIRMSHNPHMPELYDLCDEMGFLVIDEAFDEWEGVKINGLRAVSTHPLIMDIMRISRFGTKGLTQMILRTGIIRR